GGDNATGLGLFRKKLYRITLKDWTLDLYFICISSKILRMLDNLSTTSSAGWPTIQRRRIPFKPFETFMHRLMRTLL
ncbi:uncharacterized protein N7498_001764, partial [Penicillium cinerascens]